MSSTTVNPEYITIQLATISDLPALSKIQVAAYKSDLVSHIMTLDRPDDWSYEAWLERTTAPSFQDPDVTFIKAVDISTNRIVGWSCWSVKDGVEREDNGIMETPSGAQSGNSNGKTMAVPSTSQKPAGEVAVAVTGTTAPSPSPPVKTRLPRQVLSSLIATDATTQHAKHMTSPSSQFLSSAGRHLILQGLFVHPDFQNRGIGSALLQRFLHAADSGEHGHVKNGEGHPPRGEPLACWVHASPASWRLYERVGFKEVGKWEVDLEVVMRTGEGQGGGSGWGVYVFRYMVREGRRVGT